MNKETSLVEDVNWVFLGWDVNWMEAYESMACSERQNESSY